MESVHALHRNTPKLAVVDPRGLAIAAVEYYRKSSAEVQPEPRVTCETFDVAGRSVANWDPRLGSGNTPIPSLTIIPGLSGMSLLTVSVDAGWRLALQDEAGQVRQNWDGIGNTTYFDYDLLGRPSSVEQASANAAPQCVERLYYAGAIAEVGLRNQCGRLIRHADTAGVRELPDYSLQGTPLTESRRFLTELDHPGWPVAQSQQNALLEQGEDKTYRTHWHYDASGAMLGQIDAAGHTRRFAYTVHGQLQSTWLTVVGKSEQLLACDITRNAFGQVERERAGNGVISSSVYDPVDGRLRQLLAIKGGRCLQDLRYDYDPVGNILCMTDESRPVSWFANQRVDLTSCYGYDTLYQLISATGREIASSNNGPALPELISPPDPSRLQSYSQSWCYDAGGNLLEQRHRDKPTHFMDIDTVSNRGLKRVPGQVPDFDANFDRNGNLRFLAPGQPLHWTVRNQLDEAVLVTRADGRNDIERYVYDATGMRVRKVRVAQALSTVRSAEVRYLPGLEIRTEGADSSDEVLHVVNVQAGRSIVRLLHWVLGQPDEIEEDQLRYSLDDYLGSGTIELDHDGNLISYEGYFAYGGTAWWMGRSQIEAKYKFVRYSGKECNAVGLYCYGVRYYASWLLRWINPDPAGIVDGFNLFCFVKGNPIVYLDKFGLYAGKGDEVEKQTEQKFEIVMRGRSEAEEHHLEILDRVIKASGEVLDAVLIALTYEDQSGRSHRILRNVYKGLPVHVDELVGKFKVMSDAVALYSKSGSRSDQIVFVNPKDEKNRAIARVVIGDPEKRIFMTPMFFQGNLTQMVKAFIHEVSHLELEAVDFFYYHSSLGTSDFLSGSYNARQFNKEVAEKIAVFPGEDVFLDIADEVDAGMFGAGSLKTIFGTSNRWAIGKNIEAGGEYRGNILSGNADTLALSAIFIGQHALHKHFTPKRASGSSN
ncbi:RHS repeat domain-containing protein [Pseudomonas sp. XS1P51]